MHSVQGRVKSKKKLGTKYADPSKGYCQLTDITDLVGLRIITYYDDEVDPIADMLKREFSVDSGQSIDKRVVQPDHFGYFALNLVCSYDSERLQHTEYKTYAGHSFEIQVTSILRHAWSEIEHDWYDLKDRFPPAVKRKFYRLAALLELAEQEFVEIRKSKRQHENAAFARVEAEVPNVAIDVASLRAFIEQEQLVHSLDNAIVQLLGSELSDEVPDRLLQVEVGLLVGGGFRNIEDLRVGLRSMYKAVLRYVEESLPLWSEIAHRKLLYEKGFSIFHYGMLSLGRQDEAYLRKLMSELQINFALDTDVHRQFSIAKKIIKEHCS